MTTGTADTTLATYTQGFLTSLKDPRGVPRSYRYDLRGLMVAELDQAGAVDSARYDAAGLVTTHRTRLAASVTNTWDVADRLTKTVIPARTLSSFGQSANVPADSVVVAYDSLGNALTATSRIGVVRRSYYESGHLKSERVMPTGGLSLADSSRYEYDSAGRLRLIAWEGGDSVVHRYTTAGDLDTMRVYMKVSGAARMETWRFAWDGLGRRRTTSYPFNSMTVNYRYDRLGTLRRVISANPGSTFMSDRFEFTVKQDSVDVLGRPLFQEAVCSGTPDIAWPCDDWLPYTTRNRYNRRGALVYQERVTTSALAQDKLRCDRSGNQIQRRQGTASYPKVTTFSFPALSNRVSMPRDSVGGQSGHTDQTFTYDAAGSRLLSVKGSGTIADSPGEVTIACEPPSRVTHCTT